MHMLGAWGHLLASVAQARQPRGSTLVQGARAADAPPYRSHTQHARLAPSEGGVPRGDDGKCHGKTARADGRGLVDASEDARQELLVPAPLPPARRSAGGFFVAPQAACAHAADDADLCVDVPVCAEAGSNVRAGAGGGGGIAMDSRMPATMSPPALATPGKHLLQS
jgi:hypothetical protein